jgi:hypothetical protein
MSSTIPTISGPAAGAVIRPPSRLADIRRHWLPLSQIAAGLSRLNASAQLTSDQLAALKRAGTWLGEMHPFKIYQYPAVLRADETSLDDWWRMFLVRAGRVLESDATGTDEIDAEPDTDSFPFGASLTDNEITVPENLPQFWFWLEITSGSPTAAVVRYSDSPTDSSYDDSVNPAWTSTDPWSTWPVPDDTHVPIGYVDTQTRLTEKVALVRQFLRADLVSVPSAGSTLARFKITGLADADYVSAVRAEGAGFGTANFYIAKPDNMRPSVASEVIDGVTITYTWPPTGKDNNRTARDPSNLSEAQVCYPRYAVDQIIYAQEVSNGTGVSVSGSPVSWLELKPARVWARRYAQP